MGVDDETCTLGSLTRPDPACNHCKGQTQVWHTAAFRTTLVNALQGSAGWVAATDSSGGLEDFADEVARLRMCGMLSRFVSAEPLAIFRTEENLACMRPPVQWGHAECVLELVWQVEAVCARERVPAGAVLFNSMREADRH